MDGGRCAREEHGGCGRRGARGRVKHEGAKARRRGATIFYWWGRGAASPDALVLQHRDFGIHALTVGFEEGGMRGRLKIVHGFCALDEIAVPGDAFI